MTDNTTDTAKEANSAESTTEQPIIDDTIITAGSLSRGLKKCREEADMDIKQAADEMRLPLGVLKALEAENFTDLPEPPYIRGYLRSYSRLNDSDPNDLIRRYEVLRGADPDDVASFTPSMPLNRTTNKPTVSPSTVKLAGLALIVLLLGVLSMIPAVSQWATDTWQSFSQKTAQQQTASEIKTAEQNNSDNSGSGSSDKDAGDNNTANSSDLASSSNDTAAGSDNSEQLALNDQDESSAAADASEENKTPVENTATSVDDKTEEKSEAASDPDSQENTKDTTEADSTEESTEEAEAKKLAEQKAEEEAEAAAKLAEEKKAAEEAEAKKLAEQKAEEEAVAAAKLAEEKKAAEEAEAKKLAEAEAAKKAQQQAQQQSGDNFQQPIDGTVMIRLDFTESVWMSIKNGKGKSIFSALNAPGTRKELKARTPLNFKVGNAPGVKIYLNGQLVDQTPYTNGSVAKFSVN